MKNLVYEIGIVLIITIYMNLLFFGFGFTGMAFSKMNFAYYFIILTLVCAGILFILLKAAK